MSKMREEKDTKLTSYIWLQKVRKMKTCSARLRVLNRNKGINIKC